MRAQKLRRRLTLACLATIAATLALSGSAEGGYRNIPIGKRLLNSCTCACRGEVGNTVYIANKDFYSEAPCGSYEGSRCNVTVTKSGGTTYSVSGKWEACVDHGKVWVRIFLNRFTGQWVGRPAILHPGMFSPWPSGPVQAK